MISSKALLSIILFSMPIAAYSVSFDCTKARSVSEKAICQNDLLGSYDDLMNAAFRETIDFCNEDAQCLSQLRTSQSEWLKKRDAQLGVDALKRYHSDRILTLLAHRDGNFAILKHVHPNFHFDEIIRVISEGEAMSAFFHPEITLMPFEGNNAIHKSLFVLQIDTWMAAYNRGSNFYAVNLDGTMSIIEFQEPMLHEELDKVTMTGLGITSELTNASLNGTIVQSYLKWRGVGDAYEGGRWTLYRRNDEVRAKLQYYEIDPSYDGEITPIEVFASGKLLFEQGDILHQK